ncbi:Afadin- and alpha-actinin-binding protein [Blyttiomyces sp. JEL0837]|nr:Afadin- and alpha-actinin-binding protein [Blyttiomyces sp. JEL0837]
MDRLQFVSNLLQGAGFSCNLYALEELQNQEDASGILNCVFALLNQIKKEYVHRDELNEKLRGAVLEADTYANTCSRLKQSLESAERQLNIANNKLNSTEKAYKEMSAKYQTAKDESAKTTQNLQTSLAQFKHNMKKKESELTVIKERLQKLIVDQCNSQKISIRILNPSSKKVIQPAVAAGKKSENEMYEIVVSTYEEREKEILAENELLRTSLKKLYSECKTFRRELIEMNNSVESDIDLKREESRFRLPYNLIQNEVEEAIVSILNDAKSMTRSLEEKLSEITTDDRIHSVTAREDAQCSSEEIAKYKAIIDQQQELLKRVAEADSCVVNFSSYEDNEEEKAELEEMRKKIERQSESLMQERKEFHEAVIRFVKERATFDRERDLWEEARRDYSTQQILQGLPSTPGWMKGDKNVSAMTPGPSQTEDILQRIDSVLAMNTPKIGKTMGRSKPFDDHEILVESKTFATASPLSTSIFGYKTPDKGHFPTALDAGLEIRKSAIRPGGNLPLGSSIKSALKKGLAGKTGQKQPTPSQLKVTIVPPEMSAKSTAKENINPGSEDHF